MNEILAKFKELGLKASYHFADDTGQEWGSGKELKNAALTLFDANPELQDEMFAIAKDFLWSLRRDRPDNKAVETTGAN